MKRRGPPNKHAEAARAAKAARLEPNISPGPHNAAETLVSISGTPQDPQRGLDAEQIAPWPVLTLLIDDFFTYIHPLAPFPHETTFRGWFTARKDRTDPLFLALLASMIGCLVASFPRTARLHLKTQPHGMQMYPKMVTLVERCRTIALQARGPSFYTRDDISVYDAATSYFLGLAASCIMQWKVCRRFMGEAMTFIRELGYHKPRDLGSSMLGVTYRGPSFNHVEDQLGKRIFWTMFITLRSMYQVGTHHSDIVLAPPTPTEPYPEFPVEVDDHYILPHQILGQPEGVVSLLTGFNQVVKIYLTMNQVVSAELSYGLASLPVREQKLLLSDSLQALKQTLDGLPRELTIDLTTGAGGSGPNHALSSLLPTAKTMFDERSGNLHYCPIPFTGLAQQPNPDFRPPPTTQPDRRRLLQYEIQKANIYTSHLATRSYFVERYLDAHREHTRAAHHHHAQHLQQNLYPPLQLRLHPNLQTTTAQNGNPGDKAAGTGVPGNLDGDDKLDRSMAAERDVIVQHLLTVFDSITLRAMEPNGPSLITKIRQVASTLVSNGDTGTVKNGGPASAVTPVSVKHRDSLARFVEVLMRLERIPSTSSTAPSVGLAGMAGYPGLGGIAPGVASVGAMDAATAAGVAVGMGGGAGDDEEQELRRWADLRDHQVRYFPAAGFMGIA
jgi:hypothetical protein